jgi:hypothetical protein
MFEKISPIRVVKGKDCQDKINLRTAVFPEMDFLIESRHRLSDCNLNSSSMAIKGPLKENTAFTEFMLRIWLGVITLLVLWILSFSYSLLDFLLLYSFFPILLHFSFYVSYSNNYILYQIKYL